VQPGAALITPAFGAGLTFCAHVIRWGERVTPLGSTDVELPPCEKTAVELVRDTIARKGPHAPGLQISLPGG
jgi:3-oxoacyl-[acyl-carrier-protein] synthase-3